MLKVNMAPIIVTHTFPVRPDTVWRAITELDLMRQWYFDNIPSFKAQVGFKTQFPVQSQGRLFTHLWRVTEVVPQKKIVCRWRFEEYPGDSFVTFELWEQKGATTLTLTVNVTESFPEDIPEFQRESCVGGWEYFIGERLKNFLAKAS